MQSDKPECMYKVGDKVRSSLCGWKSLITLKVSMVQRDGSSISGFRITASGEGLCPGCSSPYADAVDGIDASWFERIENDCPYC